MGTLTASVLFTDIVGSADLASRLDPEAARAVRSEHFQLMREAVRATGGREVKSLGGGLMVVYAGVGDSLDGAVTMQQAAERYNRDATEPLLVKIGLSTGDVSEEDGDYFGERVVEAARLCAAAEDGQILTTDLVRMLASHGQHRFRSLGALQLKGLAQPTEAHEVQWEPVVAATVPLPPRLAWKPLTGVIGRSGERARLGDAQKVAFKGEGHRVLLVAGEPGVGKTTLAGELGRSAHGEGATVLYGRCEDELGLPYQPFVEALGGFVAEASLETLCLVDDRHLREASRLLPQLRDRLPALDDPPSTDPDAERHLLFGAVTALITRMAGEAPVVLVLDDLHWADKPSILLLRHLVSTLDTARVLVVGTYRNTDLDPAHPFVDALATLSLEPSVERVTVEGLDDVGVAALLEAFVGHDLDSSGIALAQAVRLETNGNPFFAAEVLRHLAETSAIHQEEGRWVTTVDVAGIGLPDSVREVVGQRVRRLGEVAHQVLRLAAVLGREFDVRLLARVADRSTDEILDVLETAMLRQIVAEVDGRIDRFTFTHALYQHTLHDELSVSRRRWTHRRIAELLELDCGDEPGDRIGELAQHWIAAASGDERRKAASYARRAGEWALGALAPDAAIGWFRSALDLLTDAATIEPTERLDALIGLGASQLQAGDPEHRVTLLTAAAEAAEAGATDRQVAAALANNRGIISSVGTVDAERIAMLERAIEALGGDDGAERALLLATLAAEVMDSGDRARVNTLAAEAEAIARRIDDDETLLRVLNLTFLAVWGPATLERDLAASAEALALAERLEDPVARFWAALNRVYATSANADRAGIDEALALTESLSQQIGQPFISSWAIQVRCPQVLLLGDVEEAERLADQALGLNLESAQPDAFTVYGANIAGVRLHQGRLEEFLPLIGQAAADNPGIPAFQAAYAQMLVECDRNDEARLLLESAQAADFSNEMFDYGWITMTTLWADAAATLADHSAASILYDRLLPYASQGVTSGASFSGTTAAFLARLACVLGRRKDALAHFEHAHEILTGLRAPFWTARNQVAWAQELIQIGHREELELARRLLADAQSTAAACGSAGVEERATTLLGRLEARGDTSG